MGQIRRSIVSAPLSKSALALFVMATPAVAQTTDRHHFELPAQPLNDALRAVAGAERRSIGGAARLLLGKQAPALSGDYTAEEAVAALLAGSGLRARLVGSSLVVEAVPSIDQSDAAGSTSDLVVTGSRIRGTAAPSPVIRVGQEEMRDLALADMGNVVRRIPQSFGGGQNPGIGMNVPSGSGVDIGGSSSVNLRGLGSDATLTLLNGHRLSYTAVKQSVDVSAIPASAVERIEIVPDGASAIYGSDAVAGVANIILARNYSGLETSSRLAVATQGGDFQQQYGALFGRRWSRGGIMAAYEYGSNRAIRADQRDYAATRTPGLTLFPALRHHSMIASAHQSLTDTLIFEVDGLYNIRWSKFIFPTMPGGDLNTGRAILSSVDKSYGVAPSLKLDVSDRWRVELSGTYGKERVDYDQVECTASGCVDPGASFYRNTAKSVALDLEGTVAVLPGGPAKLAVGTGYREISFQRFAGAGSSVNTQRSQDSYHAFGELSLPLVGARENGRFVRSLTANAALRYERYPGIGGVATPKLGLVWSPSADFDVKGSWGKSFRAATLYQQYQPRSAYLFPQASLGGTSTTAGATAILIVGGNAGLKPERATSWTATLAIHPRGLPGLSLELSYFDVLYKDRIVVPISLTREALSNPVYRDYIQLNPSSNDQFAARAGVANFLNLTGKPYDPANVIALINDANLNAGRQTAHGVDVLAHYVVTLPTGQTVTASGNIAYLTSDQQLSPGQPIRDLAGIIFNPPHWRGQFNLGWSKGPATLTASVNYTGGVDDSRFTPSVRVRSMTTVDLTARYRPHSTSPLLAGLDLTLSAQNLFDAAPDPISTSLPFDTPYDSTNYSPVGRLIAIGLRKSW